MIWVSLLISMTKSFQCGPYQLDQILWYLRVERLKSKLHTTKNRYIILHDLLYKLIFWKLILNRANTAVNSTAQPQQQLQQQTNTQQNNQQNNQDNNDNRDNNNDNDDDESISDDSDIDER